MVSLSNTIAIGVRPTGGTGFNPTNQANLALWVDAQQYTGATDVAQWDDLSGNNQHLKQTVTLDKPTYQASNAVANGHPAIFWAHGSTPEHLISDADVSYKDIYIVTAYKDGLDALFDTFNCLITGDDASFGGPRVIGNGGTNEISANNTVDATPEKNGGPASAVVLPMPLSVLRATAGSVVTMRALGTNFINGTTTPTTGRNWQGPICEVIAYTTTRTSVQNDQILSYLENRWGITRTRQFSDQFSDKFA